MRGVDPELAVGRVAVLTEFVRASAAEGRFIQAAIGSYGHLATTLCLMCGPIGIRWGCT